MKQVYQLLGLNKPVEGDCGIEIECEGMGLKGVEDGIWRSEADGSLRGNFHAGTAMEWVFHKPLPFGAARGALEQLAKAQAKAKLDFSFRTSVHVHVNVQKMTHAQVCALVYAYLLLEEVMMDQCGEERKCNRFCLRAVDAEGTFDMIGDMFKGEHQLIRIPPDGFRYSALNLEAMRKYGSIEFRGMRGMLDVDHLTNWVEMLQGLREYGAKMGSPFEVRKDFLSGSPEMFARKVFGDRITDRIWSDHYAGDVCRNFSLSIDLPFAFKAAQDVKKVVREKAAMPARGFDPEAFRMEIQRNWEPVDLGPDEE